MQHTNASQMIYDNVNDCYNVTVWGGYDGCAVRKFETVDEALEWVDDLWRMGVD